jgi:hypothetical protein
MPPLRALPDKKAHSIAELNCVAEPTQSGGIRMAPRSIELEHAGNIGGHSCAGVDGWPRGQPDVSDALTGLRHDPNQIVRVSDQRPQSLLFGAQSDQSLLQRNRSSVVLGRWDARFAACPPVGEPSGVCAQLHG